MTTRVFRESNPDRFRGRAKDRGLLKAGFQPGSCRVVLVMASSRRRDAAQACLEQDEDIHLVGVAPRPPDLLTRACDVVVADHDLEEDPAGLDGLERLARIRPVLATSRSALRVDIWMLRSCGASGFEADTAGLSAGVRAVLAGRERWPAGLGPAPSWVAEPLPSRICSFIRSRERAKFARLIHDHVLQSLEGLAVSPEVDAAARQLLVDEGARLRLLIEQWRTCDLRGQEDLPYVADIWDCRAS